MQLATAAKQTRRETNVSSSNGSLSLQSGSVHPHNAAPDQAKCLGKGTLPEPPFEATEAGTRNESGRPPQRLAGKGPGLGKHHRKPPAHAYEGLGGLQLSINVFDEINGESEEGGSRSVIGQMSVPNYARNAKAGLRTSKESCKYYEDITRREFPLPGHEDWSALSRI